jgi:hypothetical protein
LKSDELENLVLTFSIASQLASAEIGKHPLFRDCISLVRDVANFMAESGKRGNNLKLWQEICECDIIKLEQLSQVIGGVLGDWGPWVQP